MKNNPILTIAIPTWNRAEILDKALAALLPQISSFKDSLEIVISDNASDDHTKQIIEQYSEQYSRLNIIHYTQSENTGYYGNFKKCRELSNGQYFWLLSDNDYVANGLIDYLINILKTKSPSFIFLKDWKHDAKVSAHSRFETKDYLLKDGIESLDEVLQASQDSHPIIVKLNFNFFQMGKKAGKVPIHSISLAELQGPFFIWLILLAFSAVVCMIEKLFKLR